MDQLTLIQRIAKLDQMQNAVLDEFYTDNPENDVLSEERKEKLNKLEAEISKFSNTPLTFCN